MTDELCGNCHFYKWGVWKCTVLGDAHEFMSLPTSPACEKYESKGGTNAPKCEVNHD